MTFIVYCHTNLLNGKRYVGWTGKTLEERWAEHFRASRRSRLHFHLAIKKYDGLDIWEHEVICSASSEEEAKQLERFWISELKTTNFRQDHNGYNMTDGGDGTSGFTYSEEQRANIKRIRAEMKEIHRQNNIGDKNPMFGRCHSHESIEKNRKSNIATHNRPDVKERNRLANQKTHNDPVFKEAQRKRLVEAMNRPEVREKLKRTRELRKFKRLASRWFLRCK